MLSYFENSGSLKEESPRSTPTAHSHFLTLSLCSAIYLTCNLKTYKQKERKAVKKGTSQWNAWNHKTLELHDLKRNWLITQTLSFLKLKERPRVSYVLLLPARQHNVNKDLKSHKEQTNRKNTPFMLPGDVNVTEDKDLHQKNQKKTARSQRGFFLPDFSGWEQP